MTKTRLMTLLVMIGLTAGCTKTMGEKFNAAGVDSLVPGTTTYSEAAAVLGTPVGSTKSTTGKTAVTWSYITGTSVLGSSTTDASKLVIVFDANGVMERVALRTHLSQR